MSEHLPDGQTPAPEFAAWLEKLNAEAKRRGYAGCDTFWQDTGADCWLPYYEDKLTPEAALDTDESYA